MSTDPKVAGLLDLSGQVALITGASRGIGRTIAEVFAGAGANLALVARTTDVLEETVAELRQVHPAGAEPGKPTVLALPADVASEEQVNQAVQQIVDTWGRVDVLVNNAGLMSSGPVDEVEPADWERIIGANLTGTYLCCRAVAPLMKQQQHGRIINVSSVTAQTGGVSGGVHYSASKGGMLSMTKTLARDLASFSITVNAITPGQIDTVGSRLSAEAIQRVVEMIPLGRLGTSEDIAYAALFLASPMAAYITGATIDVNGGILKR